LSAVLQLVTGNQLVPVTPENGTIGIDEVTEYFLVGSFASWIVALGGLALAR
jgi:hypothetical protein